MPTPHGASPRRPLRWCVSALPLSLLRHSIAPTGLTCQRQPQWCSTVVPQVPRLCSPWHAMLKPHNYGCVQEEGASRRRSASAARPPPVPPAGGGGCSPAPAPPLPHPCPTPAPLSLQGVPPHGCAPLPSLVRSSSPCTLRQPCCRPAVSCAAWPCRKPGGAGASGPPGPLAGRRGQCGRGAAPPGWGRVAPGRALRLTA
jgi:hypothetical protein